MDKKKTNSVHVAIGGRSVPVEISRHPRARRYTLRIDRARAAVRLTVPPAADLKAGLRFVERKSDWIAARLDDLPNLVRFGPNVTIPVRGRPHRIVATKARRGVVTVDRSSGEDQLVVPGDPDHVARRVRDWLKSEARRDLEPAVFDFASKLDVRPSSIRIRDTKSRWGSCSSTGGLSFSWRLILAPRNVLDYVAAHEVAHLRELNHSKRFWDIVYRLYPDADGPREWLRREGPALHAYVA